ncbi:hypothetical protein LWI29_025759 [Acer saccharum]|uniref:DUF1985 domain-containing protein n=1 Tax=Acer saccharum TaxID=4024 RepID=A0AA39RJM4_ACESA|nr:hypothetical protein LWI29_025759 [Acer saccharum]
MGGQKLLESLKIKECDRFPSRVSGYCNWDSIKLIKSCLSEKQLDMFKATCFGHFLNVSDMVLSGQFCHHILLRECHVKNDEENSSHLWYHVGNGVIRFSPVEFCLVSGLAFGEYSESTSNLFKRKNSRLRRSYFQESKVSVKMVVDWFRNLIPNNNNSDEDMVKLALILLLEMTLVGKDDRNAILYWALELVDDLDAFNRFPWGSFIYARTFNSLASCLVGRDDKFKDKFKEGVDAPSKRKVERYNVYGFLTAFQVWGIEAIPKWATVGYAVKVNNVAPRILNWRCTETPSYVDILKNIFKFKSLTIYKVLGPSDDESKKPYWAGMDQLEYVSPDVDGCVGEDDVEDDVDDDVEDDVGDANQNDIEGDHQTTTFKKFEVGGKKKELITLEKIQKRLDDMQAQQNALQDQMISMHDTLMDEMRMGFLRLTELICLKKVSEELNEHNTTDFSQDDNIQDYEPSNPRGVQSPEFVVVSKTSEDVKQLSRPPKLTIKVPRDRKRSAVTVSPYTDPTTKRPKKPKMQEFGSDNQVDEEIIRLMQSWIKENNTCMDVGLLVAKPAWFQLLLSPEGWLEGDHIETYCRLMRRRAIFCPQLYNKNIVFLDYTFMIKIQGRWSTLSKSKKQFKHENYKWDGTMMDYVIGKYPVHASVNWRTIDGVSNFVINMLFNY